MRRDRQALDLSTHRRKHRPTAGIPQTIDLVVGRTLVACFSQAFRIRTDGGQHDGPHHRETAADAPVGGGGRRSPTEGSRMSDQDLELNVTDEVLGAPNVASPQMQGQIDATSRAVASAEQGYRTDETGSASWERRGLLQRLRRRPRPGAS
jgi:hypothetical protein